MATDDRHAKSVTLIKDLRPGMKNVTCVFIVIDKGQFCLPRTFLVAKNSAQKPGRECPGHAFRAEGLVRLAGPMPSQLS